MKMNTNPILCESITDYRADERKEERAEEGDWS